MQCRDVFLMKTTSQLTSSLSPSGLGLPSFLSFQMLQVGEHLAALSVTASRREAQENALRELRNKLLVGNACAQGPAEAYTPYPNYRGPAPKGAPPGAPPGAP
jgi:hypothetical protein